MKNRPQGFAIVTVLIMIAVFAIMLLAYYVLTHIQLSAAATKVDKTSGFYSAEGALNLRGETIRETFVGFNRPSGHSPAEGSQACAGNNMGSGDFICMTHNDIPTNGRTVKSYVIEAANNPIVIESIPNGRYQGLSAQEYRYDVLAEAFNTNSHLPEARLQMRFRSRLIPLFQFAAFYEGDLEVHPGPPMTLSGRVHSNSNLYLGSGNGLTIDGKVTAAGGIFGGRKYTETNGTRACYTSTVTLPTEFGANNRTVTDRQTLPCQNGGYTAQDLAPFKNNVQQNVRRLEVPTPEVLEPDPTNQQSQDYWEKADLRIVLKLDASGNPTFSHGDPSIEVQNADGTLNNSATNHLLSGGCRDAVGTSDSFRNIREGEDIRMLEVDMEELLGCIGNGNSLVNGGLGDTTQGGLVIHFSVDGPDSDNINHYGVRVKNGKELDPHIKGLTVVTDQAMYVQGDYNAPENDRNKKPASFLADSLNILSNNWNDENSSKGLSNRIATETKINAAFLAGVDDTREGNLGSAAYNGGLENYPRFHEDWTSKTLRLRGSFVSLGTPQHVNGRWIDQSYVPPLRDWNYDLDFNDARNLPPLSPRFVELVQEIFTREFTRQY